MTKKATEKGKDRESASAGAGAVGAADKKPARGQASLDKQVEVVRTERFVEPAPAPAPPEPQPEPEPPEPFVCALCEDVGCEVCAPELDLYPEEELEPEPKKSEVDIILEEAAESESHKLIVYLLPNYKIDRRSDKAAELSYCTTIRPVTTDYLATVATHYGGGDYLFELYETGRGIVKRWHKSITKAVVEPAPALAPAVSAAVEQKSTSLKSELKRFRELAEDWHEIQALLNPNSSQTAAATPAAAPAPSLSTDERLLLLAEKRPELADKVIEKLLGPSESGSLIAEALKNPHETRSLIKDILGEVRFLFHPPQPNGSGNGNAGGQAAPAEPVDDLERALLVVVEDLKKNKRVGRAADVIDELLSKRPDLVVMFDRLINLEPAGLLAELSKYSGENLHEYGHAISFVENLRDALRPADVIEEEA
jgi:hypothetical protein